MERDSLLGHHDRRSRGSHVPYFDADADRRAARTPVETSGWRSRTAELRRSETEKVKATFWSRGEELVVTLQWMVMGEDGRWMPVNTPPEPSFLRDW